jgi:hypothetical protein
MVRMKKFSLAALNIKTEPHSPEGYLSLLEFIFEKKILGKIRGHDYLMIGSLKRFDVGEPHEKMAGFLYKFTDIDPHLPWVDINTRRRVENETLGFVLEIPESIKPNLKEIPYVFHADRHRLVFESTSPSASSIMKAFDGIFSDPLIRAKFGLVDVELEISQEAIETILGYENIRKLNIRISRPNPDDISELEEEVYRRLNNQNIRSIEETMTSSSPEGICPDDYTKAMMNVSRSNGVTSGTAREDGEDINFSTRGKARVCPYRYNPLEESLIAAVIRESNDFLRAV